MPRAGVSIRPNAAHLRQLRMRESGALFWVWVADPSYLHWWSGMAFFVCWIISATTAVATSLGLPKAG